MIYLATPYTHDDPSMMRRRFELVTRAAAYLCAMGECVYSPISHGHPIGLEAQNPIALDVWKEMERTIMPACSELLVVIQYGWRDSEGAMREIRLAQKCEIPVRGLRLKFDEQHQMMFEVIELGDA
jgi:hypothetical protein